MTYSPATIAKAIVALATATIGAAVAAAHGPDLSSLDLGQWLIALGAGLTAAGGVFVTPNKSTVPALSPADQVISCLPQVIQNVNHANGELDRVKQAIEVLGHRPLGPLATQVIQNIQKQNR